MSFQFGSSNHHSIITPLRVGGVNIPYLPLMERKVEVLLRDVLPINALVPPILKKFGISPDSLDPFMGQLLSFPRIITDRSPSTEFHARKRVDLAIAVAETLKEEPFKTSETTRYAGAWVHLYFTRIGEVADLQRLKFLEHLFVDLPKIEGGVTTILTPKKNINAEVVARLSARLPREATITLRDESLPPPVSAEETQTPRLSTRLPSVEAARRATFLNRLLGELCNDEFLLKEESKYTNLARFFSEPFGTSVGLLESIQSSTPSRLISRYARITKDVGAADKPVYIKEYDYRYRGDFSVEIPSKLVFETPSFGRVTAIAFITSDTILISGETFAIFDRMTPLHWQNSKEQYEWEPAPE